MRHIIFISALFYALINNVHLNASPLPGVTNLLIGLANNADSPHNMWAFDLALAEINAITNTSHPFYVPTTIKQTWLNTQSSVIQGFDRIVPAFERMDDSHVLFIGEKNSAYAAAGIQMAAYYNRSTLINAGLGALLNNRNLFNSSVRIVSADAGFVEAWLVMIKLYHWKQFTLLVTEDDQGIAFYEALAAVLPGDVVMNVLSCPILKMFPTTDMFNQYLQNVMDVLKRSDMPIVLTIGTPATVVEFLQKAYENRLLGRDTGYQWFVAGSTCTNTNIAPLTRTSALTSMSGAICMMNSYASGQRYDEFNERMWTESKGVVKRTANMAIIGAFYDTPYFIVEALKLMNRSTSMMPLHEQILGAMYDVNITGPSTGRRMNLNAESGQVFALVDFIVADVSNTTINNITTWRVDSWKRLGSYSGLDGSIDMNDPMVFQDGNHSAIGILSESNLGYVPIDFFAQLPDGTNVKMNDTQWAYVLIVFVLGIMHGGNTLACLASSIKTALRLEYSSVKKTAQREAVTGQHTRHNASSDTHGKQAQQNVSSSLTWGFVKTTMIRKSHSYRWNYAVFMWFFVAATSLSLFYIVPSHFLVLLFQSFDVNGIDAHFKVDYLVGSILISWFAVNASIAVLCWHHYQAAMKMSIQLLDVNDTTSSSAWTSLFHPYIWLSTVLLDAAMCIPFHMSRQAIVLPVSTHIDPTQMIAAPLVLLLPLYACLYWMLPVAMNAEATRASRIWSMMIALCVIGSQWILSIQAYSYTFVNALLKQPSEWDVSQVWVLTALLMGIGVLLYTGLAIQRNQFSVSVMDLQLSKHQSEEAAIRHRNVVKQQDIEKMETTLADCQQTLLRLKHGRPGFRPVALLLLKQEIASGDKATFDDEILAVTNGTETPETLNEADYHGTSLSAIICDVVLCEHLKDHLAHAVESQDLITLYQDVQQLKRMKNHDLRQEYWNRFSHQVHQYNLDVTMADVDHIERFVIDELQHSYQQTALYRYTRAQFDLL